jgi:25S rRNA (uracil2634-N3)-methyltransferase
MGFFKSASSVLATGPPNIVAAKKRKVTHDEDSEPEGEEDAAGETEDAESEDQGCRGTVLVTLRNAIPYTLWYAHPFTG